MGEFLLWVVGFIMVMALIEFFAMMMTFDDYGSSALVSFIMTFVIFMGILGLILVSSEETPSDQDNQLEAQWSEKDIAEVLEIEELEQKEVEEYYNDVEKSESILLRVEQVEDLADTDVSKVRTTQVVPSNRSYIDSGRRDYSTTVIYDHETREACDDDECFKVRLVQHTDGSYWACKRNYGVCYEYQ